MRHTFRTLVAALFLSLISTLAADHRLLAADKAPPATPKPLPYKVATTAEKLKDLGRQLGRAVDIALDLLSNNQADLLSGNTAALLSGNKAALLSGNTPTILSGNTPKLLSENTTPILSGNSFSVLSNIKIEIHIENSGNNPPPRSAVPPHLPSVTPPSFYGVPGGMGGGTGGIGGFNSAPRAALPTPTKKPQPK